MSTKKTSKKSKPIQAKKSSPGEGELSDAELGEAAGGTIFRVDPKKDKPTIVPLSSCTYKLKTNSGMCSI